jgi:hypothetical protein
MARMTYNVGPIWNMLTHLEIRCRGGDGESTMKRLAESGLDLGGASTVYDLAMACTGTTHHDQAEDILRGLIALASVDELAALGALAALFPALIRVSRRLVGCGIDPEQADSDVLATSYERVLELSDDPPRHAARAVIGATWDRVRSSLKSEQRCTLRTSRLEAASDKPTPWESRELPGLQWVLTDAVSAGVISSEAARIIDGTRAQGRSCRSLADELNRREPTVRKVRQRAERALIESHGQHQAEPSSQTSDGSDGSGDR